LYYSDFYINNFIALGWDLVTENLVSSIKKTGKEKRKEVSALYPKESRPGLILGQMDTFYNKMRVGDLVVIPSDGCREIAIGSLGDITKSITHKLNEDEYSQCVYVHIREVRWLKKVDLWTDVFLSKVLRAQQTISDISEYAEMIFRNLYPCYCSQKSVHLTLQKTSVSDYSITDSYKLQYSVIRIIGTLSEYYETHDESDCVKIKTAVGSPGFMEFILPLVPISAITVGLIIKTLIGKTKSSDGNTNTGIMAIISKVNELMNDQISRKKVKAEIGQIDANTKRSLAETEKTQEEARALKISNDKAVVVAEDISKCCDEIKSITTNSGIRIVEPLKNGMKNLKK